MSKENTATAEKTKENKKVYRKMVSQFGIQGIEFDSAQDYLGVMMHDEEFTLEDFKKRVYFCALSKLIIKDSSAEEVWNSCRPYTAAECIKKFSNNESRLSVAFKYIGPDKALEQLKGELVSEQKLVKKQKKLALQNPDIKSLMSRHNKERLPADAFKKEDVEYEDVYKLFKIPKETYHKVGMTRMDIDTYVVECICPSKGDHFFLYVPAHEVEQCRTAFGAIAWTMKKPDGSSMTIEEWKSIEEEQ